MLGFLKKKIKIKNILVKKTGKAYYFSLKKDEKKRETG